MGVDSHCHSCGIGATDGQSFAQETVPLRGVRTYCPNCHARLRRRFFQAGLALDLAIGVVGVAMVWRDPASGFGHSCLNFFLFQLGLVLATIPHEFGRAWAAHLAGLRLNRIIIGFGPPVFAGRIMGGLVEWRRIPYGGSVHAEAGSSAPLSKHLAFAAGGLGCNFLLALAAWFFLGGRHSATEFSGPVQFGWLFFMANMAVVVHHLFPHARNTPLGRVPSDGLALWQILIQRRAPAVVERLEPPTVETINLSRRTAKTVITGLFATGAVACFAAVLLLSRVLFSSSTPLGIWVAVVLFVLLGGTFAWGAVFLYNRPWQAPQPMHDHAVIPHGDVLKSIQTEIARRSPWLHGLTLEQARSSVEPAARGQHLPETLGFLEASLSVESDNMQLQFWKGLALGWAGRHDEAAAHFADVLDLGDLGLAMRVAFLLERCKAHLRAGQRHPAWVHCGEYLDEPGLLPEQLFLLDNLARLPLEESRPELIPDADYWSQQALNLQPENLTLQATRGALLYEQGREDEAELLLQHVRERSEADADKALAEYYLALMARRRGDDKGAARLVRHAQLLHPAPWLAQRLASVTQAA